MSAQKPATDALSEPTFADRVARAVTLAKRARAYWASALVVFVLGIGLTALLVKTSKRTYMSECTIAVRAIPKPGERDADHGERRAARLKDMVSERGRLEATIRKFGLYKSIVENRDMIEAIDAMKNHVGFRARESGRYVISFDSEEIEGTDTRTLVKDVTQFLADSVMDDYVGGGIKELQNEEDFLAKEKTAANAEIDTAIQKVTTFLSAHPEFAVEPQGGTGPGLSPVTLPKPGLPAPVPTLAPRPLDPAAASARLRDPWLGSLYRQKARLEAQLKPAPVAPVAPPAPDASRDEAKKRVDAAQKRVAETQADLLSKQSTLTAEHPDMKAAELSAFNALEELRQAKAQLALIDARNAPDAGPAVAADPAIAKELESVNTQIAAREAQLATGAAPPAPVIVDAGAKSPPVFAGVQGTLETEWQRLLRALSDAKSRHDDVKKRYETAQLGVKGAQMAKEQLVSLVEPAYRPMKPSKSRRFVTALAGSVSSIALALLWIFARLTLDDHVVEPADVEALAIAQVLGAVPRPALVQTTETAMVKAEPDALAKRPPDAEPYEEGPLIVVPTRAAPTHPEVLSILSEDGGAVDALRVIRHRLELLHDEGKRVFAVTSAKTGEGKSIIAAQLAMVLAESQRARVVLVEGNLHHPSVAKLLGITMESEHGLSNQVIARMRGGDDGWRVIGIGPTLHVLAEAPGEHASPRVLHSAQFFECLNLLGANYDYVLIDGPSILGSGDANALEPEVDGLILVAQSGESRKSELRRAVRQIGSRKIVGLILGKQVVWRRPPV